MGLPSLRTVFTAAGDVLRRFPLVLLAAGLAATAGLVLAGGVDDDSPWVRVLLASLLGLPFFTALALLAERRVLPPVLRVALPLAAAASLAAYGFAAADWLQPQLTARTIQFLLALHLIASFLPYAGERPAPGFWPYNKTLFLRFLVAGVFSAVLFAGLALALVAIDKLFGVSIDEDHYLRLFLLVALVFHPWYFLGGIPRDLSTLDSSTDYPGGLRVFAQYILVPLVTIYLAILTAYFVRVMVTREWPSGWIGWLVSSVSVAGLLAQLLVHPVRDRHAWVATCTRAFHIGMLPATVMLFAAIGKRVEQYGVTENRYFLAAWAVWILGIALYFTFGRRRSIRVIPSSMAVVALVTSFGPWGAYATAERSQIGRMEALLTEQGLLVDGRAVVATSPPPREVTRELSAIARYLMRHHGADGLRPWFEDGLAGVDSVAAAAGS
ncbi:DUF4153 domain-containing protein, partial [bacterium]|nr:DUF4153 domain-containing protein [bacterium]